jgi:hypothetical protein
MFIHHFFFLLNYSLYVINNQANVFLFIIHYLLRFIKIIILSGDNLMLKKLAQ